MRRRTLLATLAAGAGCSGLGGEGTDPSPPSPTDRPTTSTFQTPTPGGSSTGDGALRWTRQFPDRVTRPAHVGGPLQGSDSRRRLLVPTGGALHALDPATGATRWRTALDGTVARVDTLPDLGVVVAAVGRLNPPSDQPVPGAPAVRSVVALDGRGAVHWRLPDSTPLEGGLRLVEAARGLVVLQAGGRERPRTWVVHGITGERLARVDSDGLTDATITADGVFVGTSSAVAAYTRTGELRWRWPVEQKCMGGTLSVTDDHVLFVDGYGAPDNTTVRALDRQGRERWTLNEDVGASSLRLADRLLLGGIFSDTTGVSSVDPRTGAIDWTSPGNVSVHFGPVVDSRVYAGGGGITAYETTDGQAAWSWTAPEFVFPRVATESAVYARSVPDNVPDAARNRVFARNAADGSERWTFETDGEPSPVTLGEHVYVGDTTGRVYALGP